MTPSADICLAVYAADPISKAGIVSQLRGQNAIQLVGVNDPRASVAIVITERLDEATVRRIRALTRRAGLGVVLVIPALDQQAIATVIDARLRTVLLRAEATPRRLIEIARAASAGDIDLPPQLLGRVVDQLGHMRDGTLDPGSPPETSISQRERDVLRLLADGLTTHEVAIKLSYSERTIKNVLQDLTTRLQLRNRTQAVAHALRSGWI